MKKTILCLLLALCLCLCLVFVACDEDDVTDEPATEEIGKKGEIKVTGAAEDAVVDRPNQQLPGYTIGY